jgi:hypothetical protein
MAAAGGAEGEAYAHIASARMAKRARVRDQHVPWLRRDSEIEMGESQLAIANGARTL